MQIAIVAFNRFDYFSKAIEAISSADGCGRWSVLVYVDSVVGAAKAQSAQSVEGNAAIVEMCEKLESAHAFAKFEYRMADRNLGCWANKKACVAAAFERSDDVLVIEDDIVVARDALTYCEWAKSSGVMDCDGVFQLSLFSYFFPYGLDLDACVEDVRHRGLQRSVYARNWATPWGWFLPRRSWDLIKDDWNGWDQWVGHRVRELGKVEIAPLISHCNNIGVVGVNRKGLEAVDIQLRGVTSDDMNAVGDWHPGEGASLEAFKESLEGDLKLVRERSDKVHAQFRHCRNTGQSAGPVKVGEVVRAGEDVTTELSKKQKAPVSLDARSKPSMDVDGLAAFERFLGGAKVFLEYGAGGSTFHAARFGVPAIFSVESDFAFLSGVWDAFLSMDTPSKLVTYHANVGPTKEWGYPVDSSSAQKWPAYAGGVWDRLTADGASPDLVLIDGRFRVACFCTSMLAANPGTKVLFDDYIDRQHYRAVEQVAKPVAMHGRMAEFIVDSCFDRSEAVRLLLRSVSDPR